MEYRDGTKRRQTRSGWFVHICTHHTYEFPAQVNQRHKPYIVAPHDYLMYNTKLTTISACTYLTGLKRRIHSIIRIYICDNIGLVSLIYLGWEFICVVCITLLCVQTILILSAFFLCHPYIPRSNLKNFSFTCIHIYTYVAWTACTLHLVNSHQLYSHFLSWLSQLDTPEYLHRNSIQPGCVHTA